MFTKGTLFISKYTISHDISDDVLDMNTQIQ